MRGRDMDGQQYILTIWNSDIYKEVDVVPDTRQLKIGTLQDCDVRLKQELFQLSIEILLQFESGGWRISCADHLYMTSRSMKNLRETGIQHGDLLEIHTEDQSKPLFFLSFCYNFTEKAVQYDTIIDIRNTNRFVIGNMAGAQIKLNSWFAGNERLTLSRGKDGQLFLDPSRAPNSATLNGIRIFEKTAVHEFDFIGIADHSFYFKNQVLYAAARDDMKITDIPSQPLRNETPAFVYPKLNRSPRMRYAFNTEPINLLYPPQKPDKPRDNLILQMSPSLLMLAVTVITRSGLIAGLRMGNPAFLIFSVATMSVGIFTTIMSFVYNRKRYQKDLKQWNDDYTAYIAKKRRELTAERKEEREALLYTYPSLEELRDFIKTFSCRLFERSAADDDFLCARIGLGNIPAMRPIALQEEERIKIENELIPVAEKVRDDFKMLQKAPVMLHLRESGTVGIVGPDEARYSFFKNLLLDICVEHSYEDVQIIVLLPSGEQEKYQWIKWMPHLKESGCGLRGIVCDDESRDNIFESLYALMTQRSAQIGSEDYAPAPYYVVFVLEEYGIKTHPLSKYIGISAKLGVSFLYFKEYQENLPRECREIVVVTDNGGTLLLPDDKAYTCQFEREQVMDESIKFAAERLAPVYCEKIALSSRLTSNITLFDLLNIIAPENLNLLARWKNSNVQKSLAAPLGLGTKGDTVCLDLHERAHGPHGLVAGTTGSGKSEIMQSYILSAAVNFHPYEVAFVIIDFKGGGMANQFENLPHLIGKITDIDSHEINRSLLSIRAELEKRKKLFARYAVNHIDQYIGKFRSGETAVPLPHLILIVDEFAELKAEQPEFMKELISTARVGRSLGIHLILATQKPAGQVNEQIWSNSRFKLCLKVATKEDSMEVLRSPLASEILEPGRAYLQVGNNEVFTLFQSAYSGAPADSDTNGNTREFTISEVSFTGKRTPVYEHKVQKQKNGPKLTQLKALVGYIQNYCEEKGIFRLPSICLPPLPELADYPGAVSMDNTVAIGIYDDPENQLQPEARLSLSDGNVIIIGSAQTGKTTLLQTILRGIAERFTPEETSVYILDFASKILKIYSALNHVGGVLTDSDDERLKNFFKMIRREIEQRKDVFSQFGAGSYDAYREAGGTLPRMILMIDNLSAMKEVVPEYEDAVLNVCREGLALGITVIATAKQTSGLSYRYMSNFAARLAFNCTETSEYGSIFDRCPIRPKNVAGRGLLSINKVVYEYQAYLPFDGIVEETGDEVKRTENQRIQQARAFAARMAERYGECRARTVPEIPAVLTAACAELHTDSFDPYTIPVGLTYSEIEPVAIDLAHVGSVGIYGREKSGKSNLVRVLMHYLQNHVFDLPCEAFLIDGYDRQMKEFETFGFVEQVTVDCADFETIVQDFSDAAQERKDILRMGGSLDNMPLLLCIIRNTQIFAANTVPRAVSDRFKTLLADAKQVKMCFILSNIENNGEYSPPEMMKIARDLGEYFLLDDLANVKFLGSSKFTPAELKQYKKAISAGDGYLYSARGGLEKIKLVKCGGEE